MMTRVLVKDRSVESNVIIAGRPKVNAKLVSCLSLDLEIANFDVDQTHDLLATCSGRVVYLFKLSTLALIDRVSIRDWKDSYIISLEEWMEVLIKVNILMRLLTADQGAVRDISIDGRGQYIASAGEDKRIAVWNIKSKVSEK